MRGSSLLVAIKPDENSVQYKKVMGENELRITFRDNKIIPFQINDWCIVFGERYQLNTVPTDTKISKYLYEYNLTMQSEGSMLSRAQFLFLDVVNNLTESDFSLMGNSDDFVDLIIDNASRVASGWVKGEVIPTGYKNLTFSKENCYNALSRISEEFETEFWIIGKTIHLTKRQTDTGNTFKHGQNKGLYEITRQPLDSSVVTRLYAFGSEKNLPSNYRNFSNRLLMTNGDPYLESNTAKYGIIEYTEIIEDIYPHRTGKVTSINAVNPYVFIDTTIDFDVNAQLLPGLTAKVVFNTGQLAGYEFEISKFNNTIKEFTILKNKNERVLDLPSTTIKPGIGDEYVLIDLDMPQTYIDAAELELSTRAQALLDQASEPQLSYQVVLDPVYIKNRGLTLSIGDLVWLVDTELQVNRRIRIVSTTRDIVNEYQYQVELSDSVSAGKLDTIINAQATNGRNISSIGQSIQNNSLLNNNQIGDLNVKQGTIVLQDIPTTSTTTGFSQLYIDDATGKIYKKV